MARMHASELPAVQFVAVSQTDENQADLVSTESIMGHFAAASVAGLGRTLLISVSGTALKGEPDLQNAAIVPDVAVPGLYHARLDGGLAAAVALSRVPRNRWPGVEIHSFSLLIVVCGPPALCPAAAVLAAQCDGSVLIVTAGTSRADDIQSARRQLASAGGQVLGTVLYQGQR